MSVLKSLKDAENIDDLAALLGYSAKTLAYILYKIPLKAKYTTFQVPKKSGGFRDISAPIDHLKVLQRHLANTLYACRDEIDRESGRKAISHGFRRGYSIVTNAQPHHSRRFVLNLDLKDFFPTFNFGRVRGFFIKNHDFALNEKVATLIAQIACHDAGLPQGSPCSPGIADLLAHLLDVRLAQLARKHRVTYTRYADDLTFSTNQKQFPAALAVQDGEDGGKWELGKDLVDRVTGAGFIINADKTRMQCRMSRQLVTGLTVNEKVNVRSEYYKETRAMCDALFKYGHYWISKKAVAAPSPVTEEKKEGESAEASASAVIAAKLPVTSLGPLGGRLAHIHHVKDQIDRRGEIEKRKHKTAFRKLYMKFLFYRAFAALDKPLVLAEGKTDGVYLSLAIKFSDAFQPKLGQHTAEGFSQVFRFFNQENKTHHVMELEGGTGNFNFFLASYKKTMGSFGHRPKLHPVILLIDNDEGAPPVLSTIKQNFGKEITLASNDAFYHLVDNLYLVKTPHIGGIQKTCIESFFEPSVLETEVSGKKFNPDVTSTDTEFGKVRFTEKVVKPNAETINWVGFAPLLQRLADVVDHYSPPSA